MTATTTALPATPRARRQSAKARRSGLQRIALKAGMYKAERRLAEPVREMVGHQ